MLRRFISVLVLLSVGCGSSGGGGGPTGADGPLSVEATDPEDGALDVPRTGRIWIRFSDQVNEDSVRLTLSPKGKVDFRYSEASGREFFCDVPEPLARTTEYRLEVEATATSGEALDPPYELSFTTGIEPRPESEQPPQVFLTPAAGESGVAILPTLSFTFSKPMEPASVEGALHFEPALSCAELNWKDDDTKLDCVVSEALPPATTFEVTLDASASSSDGVPLDAAFTSTFTTRLPPTIVSTEPADGDAVAGLEGSVALNFAPNTSMDEASLLEAFRYVSPAGHAVATASCFFEKCTIATKSPFSEGQTVKWELSTAAKDTSGVALSETVTGSLEIGRRAVVKLPAEAALDGSVTEAGVVDASGTKLSVGRNASGAVRSLLSFDLSALPANMLALSKATLELNHEPVGGAPADLGLLLVYSVSYGAKLDAAAFSAPINTYRSCNLLWQCTSSAYDAGLSVSSGNLWTAPVTQLVQRDLTEKSALSQMRVAFKQDTGQASTGTETFTSANAAANRPVLEVEYWEP